MREPSLACDNALGQTQDAGVAKGSQEAVCAACGASFKPTRRWSKFCSTRCRQTYHAKLAPEMLRRDIDELRRRVELLEKAKA